MIDFGYDEARTMEIDEKLCRIRRQCFIHRSVGTKTTRGAVASLSLHYFDDETLSGIVTRISRLLVRGGLFLFRMNSKNDAKATWPQTIERHYFSLEDCRRILRGWRERSLAELTIDYDGREKVVCEGLKGFTNEINPSLNVVFVFLWRLQSHA